MDALTDRRQRAREAYYDEPEFSIRHLDAAIEAVTQVKITDDIVSDAMTAVPRAQAFMIEEIRAMTAAAFRAAGFEVIE